MRVLLINPSYPLEEFPRLLVTLPYLAAALRAEGHEVEILDLLLARTSSEKIERRMALFRPELVGITSVTLNHHIASFVAEVVRKCDEGVPIARQRAGRLAEYVRFLARNEVTDLTWRERNTAVAALIVHGVYKPDAADVLEQLEEEDAAHLIQELDADDAAEVLEEIAPELAAELVEDVPLQELAAALNEMPGGAAADPIDVFDEKVMSMGQVGSGLLLACSHRLPFLLSCRYRKQPGEPAGYRRDYG